MIPRMVSFILALVSTIGWGVAKAHAQGIPCRYTVAHVVQAPPGPFSASPTIATAISPSGRWVVGYYLFNGSGNPRPFVYDTQTSVFSPVTLPTWLLEASPADVNDNRIMVGTGASAIAGQRGFVCDLNTAVWTELLPQNPPIGWSGATGINSSNVVSGWRSIDDGGDPVNPFNASIWQNGKDVQDLGVMTGANSAAMDISSTGNVVGWTGGNIGSVTTRAFVHDKETTVLPPVPGGIASAAVAVATDNTVAVRGRIQISPVVVEGFLWMAGSYQAMPLLPGFHSMFPSDIGDTGACVGLLRGNGDHGFVWRDGLLLDLDQLLNDPQMRIRDATSVAADGTIAAIATVNIGESVSVIMVPKVVAGDVVPDCVVNIDDLLEVIRWWGPGQSPGDANGDALVDILDLLIVIDNWTF